MSVANKILGAVLCWQLRQDGLSVTQPFGNVTFPDKAESDLHSIVGLMPHIAGIPKFRRGFIGRLSFFEIAEPRIDEAFYPVKAARPVKRQQRSALSRYTIGTLPELI